MMAYGLVLQADTVRASTEISAELAGGAGERLRIVIAAIMRSCGGEDNRDYFLSGLGRGWCRNRTPGPLPPPSSSMNSTPAASSARRTAKSLAMVIDVWPSASSARLIVAIPKAASRASCAAFHRRRARAARIWALFNGFGFIAVDHIGIV
jgi:hypothetical protein